MEDKSISLIEVLLMGVYLGSIVYVLGLILFVIIISKKIKNKAKVLIIAFLQLFFSIILSIIIWHIWFLKIDILWGCIFIPSLFAEIITILLFYFGISMKQRRRL